MLDRHAKFLYVHSKFYRKYGSPGIISLFENKEDKRPNFCSAFVSVYQELEGQEETEESLMARVERELENRGIYLDRSRIPAKVSLSIYLYTYKTLVTLIVCLRPCVRILDTEWLL